MGGIVVVVLVLLWAARSTRANRVTNDEALGMNPEVREVLRLPEPPDVISRRLMYAYDRRHLRDERNAPDAMLFRRIPDFSCYGYAFLVRIRPDETGGTQLLLSGEPLGHWRRGVGKAHWRAFQDFVWRMARGLE